ncbi:hypothetical protein C2G38_2060839, partial [Gigaspora rosea]
ECRGFAYITIESTAENWKKCTIKLFHAFHQIIKNISLIQFACPFLMVQNGRNTLKIQDAKPDYKQRLKEE